MTELATEEVIVDVKLDKKDFYEFNLRHIFRNSSTKSLIIIGFLYPILFLVTFWNMFTEGLTPPLKAYFPLLFTLFVLCYPLLIKQSARKSFATNKFLQQTQHYQLNNNQILLSSETGTAQFSWDKVYRVREEKKYFAIYISKAQAYVIPKRFLKSTNDIEALRYIIRQSLPRTKRKLKSK